MLLLSAAPLARYEDQATVYNEQAWKPGQMTYLLELDNVSQFIVKYKGDTVTLSAAEVMEALRQ